MTADRAFELALSLLHDQRRHCWVGGTRERELTEAIAVLERQREYTRALAAAVTTLRERA